MPSEKILAQKKEAVTKLKEKIESSVSGVVFDYKGITVEQDTKLRRELREAGVEYSVVKNSLFKFAIQGSEIESLSEVLEGTTALAIASEDAIAPARILSKYAKDSKGLFTIKAGYMDGKVMDANQVDEIANLPSKEGLVQMLLSVLVSGPRGLAIALNEIAKSKEEVA